MRVKIFIAFAPPFSAHRHTSKAGMLSGYPARRILTEGSGMLLRGPRSFVEGAADVLARAGIRVAKPDRGKHRGRTPCALLLGRNFVIAESFEFESI